MRVTKSPWQYTLFDESGKEEEIPVKSIFFRGRRWTAQSRKKSRSIGVRLPAAKFETRIPASENAIDIFRGHWASDLRPICRGAIAGDAGHFDSDPKPNWAAQTLGRHDRLDGLNVLELGPLEAGNTYNLERLGASVLAIEANVEAYLKCLIVKEIAGLSRARFLLGDFNKFLAATSDRFDVVYCSGVLYHMPDPISSIEMIAKVTNKVFVWSHVYDEHHYTGATRTKEYDARFPHVELWAYDHSSSMSGAHFWGGNESVSRWMRGPQMIEMFKHFGFAEFVMFDVSASSTSAALCFTACK